jgi:hypothetical protein
VRYPTPTTKDELRRRQKDCAQNFIKAKLIHVGNVASDYTVPASSRLGFEGMIDKNASKNGN